MLNDEAGLVLEGGGMRGVFTSGVLDYFMDYNIYFPYTIGVSAGRVMPCRMLLDREDVQSTVT